jgi:lipopolysaccharide export system permease protein
MRLHDRMVGSFFLRVMLFCIVGFIVIFVLADLFEKMDGFLDNQARWSSIARFYLYKLPDIVRLTLPIDVLLATLFTLGVLGKNNEMVALLSSGISMVRIGLPILLLAFLGMAASALLSEWVVPQSNARMQRIKRVEIEKHPPIDAPVRYDFNYRGRSGTVYHIRVLNTETRTMKGVTLSQAHDGRVVMRLDAEQARWVDHLWEFENGVYRTFGPESPAVPDAAEQPGRLLERPGDEKAEAFRSMRLPDLEETPEDLARIEPKPDEMNYRELRRYVERVRRSGGKVNDYVVDMYAKLADPVTIVVLAMLGIGLSARKKRSSLAAGFGLTLVIGFSYLALSEIGEALGKNETLPPILAAWVCQALFGAAGVFFLARANR